MLSQPPTVTDIPTKPFFKDWFWRTLHWPLLRPVGPIACLCEGIARAADAVWPDMAWFVRQFNPATCEIEYVDRYGKARGLVRHYKESDTRWRRRVCAAHAWHKLSGRSQGMPKILDHYGYEGSVFFNRALEGEPEKWAHFRVAFGSNQPVSDEDYEVIVWILNEIKPAKSILDSARFVVSVKGALHVAAASLMGTCLTVYPQQVTAVSSHGRSFVAAAVQMVERISVFPSTKPLSSRCSTFFKAAAHLVLRTTVSAKGKTDE